MRPGWPRFPAVTAGCLLLVVLLLSGCSRATGAPSDEAPFTVTVGERFAFSPDRLHCRAGQPVRLRLSFKLPSAGSEVIHNIAVLAAGTDPDAFGRASVEADVATGYVPLAFRNRVIAISAFAHDGETQEVRFTAPMTPGEYPVVCTFPGHCLLGMQGVLVVD